MRLRMRVEGECAEFLIVGGYGCLLQFYFIRRKGQQWTDIMYKTLRVWFEP